MPEDLGEKTELPTGRRLSTARMRGNVAKSPELSAAADLAGGLILLILLGPGIVAGLGAILRTLLSSEHVGPAMTTVELAAILHWTAQRAAWIAAPFLLIMFLVVALVQFGQVGWLWTLKP